MTRKILLFALTLFLLSTSLRAQFSKLTRCLDSLITSDSIKPFNGVVLVCENEKIIYSTAKGYSNINHQKPLRPHDQFVIGSISKQITAVILLREYDAGHVSLSTPIHAYLPELTQSWADTVTIHHLLTHTHGITEINKPTAFKAGTQFSYSQIGYDLLAKIAEKTSGKSFSQLAQELFKLCNMGNTCHPETKNYSNLVLGYTETEQNKLIPENNSFQNYVAAGSFISAVEDLNLWNKAFYGGKLLKKETMDMVKTKQPGAIRNHPVFGVTSYGYGITIDLTDNIVQLGQTGFAPGFVSMNFYFPQQQLSVIVLENIAYDTTNLKHTFSHHTAILNQVRRSLKSKLN